VVSTALQSRKLELPETADAVLDWMESAFTNGWTDGLPVVPPTLEKVRAMLASVDRDPAEVLGPVPPRMGVATLETVAIQSVMGGCLPAYFPVVLAAVEAMLDASFNLAGVQATTHNVAPLCIVSGPIVEQIGINCGTNLFGGGARANATIGRAIRLVLWNLGGGHTDRGDKSVMGSPAKWTYCIGEGPEIAGWGSLSRDQGYSADTSCVTVFACEAPHNVMAAGQTIGDVLRVIAGAVAAPGSNNVTVGGQTLVVLSPAVVQQLQAEFWTRRDTRMFLWDKARIPVSEIHAMVGPSMTARGGGDPERGGGRWPAWVVAQEHEPDARVPVIRWPDDVLLVVAGGSGGSFCAVCPGWGFVGGQATTRPIRPR
jgi:hypothetical protein